MTSKNKKNWIDPAWDLFCLLSIVGIWPRFIEPYLLTTNSINIALPRLPLPLHGLKIAHLSDLHFSKKVPERFLNSLKKKIEAFKPDIIALTGDLFCYSYCDDAERLTRFLQSLHAPHGCYVVLGNHDYAQSISVNEAGDYDLLTSTSNFLLRAFKRIFSTAKLSGRFSNSLKGIELNKSLSDLLKQTSFQCLNNESKCLPINGSFINVAGVEEYSSGRFDAEKTFKQYNLQYPGIILAHNPDAANHLKQFPDSLILSGHTHGGQINLPWIWRKLTLLEDQRFKSGLLSFENKKIYITRGLGSTFPFRWFAPPELVLITLEAQP